MSPLRALPLVAVAGALAFSGCGSSNDSSSSSTPAAAPASSSTPASTSTPAAASGGVAITMKNIAFAPTSVTVKAGQTVTWTNEDDVAHNVIADSGASFKSDLLNKGGTFTFTPKKAGTIEYECTIHPGMKATLNVQ